MKTKNTICYYGDNSPVQAVFRIDSKEPKPVCKMHMLDKWKPVKRYGNGYRETGVYLQ